MPDQNNRTTSEREFYKDSDGNTHAKETQNSETVRNAGTPEQYRDGYTHGRIAEHRHLEDNQVVRDNNNAARGLLIGIILTSVVGLGAGLYYFLNQRNDEPAPTPTTTIVPVPVPRATQSPSPAPERTIIQRERTIERVPQVVPIPQTQASPSPQPNITIQQPPSSPAPAPNVNITVPPSSLQQRQDNSATPQGSGDESRSQTESRDRQLPSQSTPAQPQSRNNNSTTPGSLGQTDTTTGSGSATGSTDTSTTGSGSATGGTAGSTSGSGSATGSTGGSGQ